MVLLCVLEEEDSRLLMRCKPLEPHKVRFNNVDRLVKRTVTQLLNYMVEAHQEEMAAAEEATEEPTAPPVVGQYQLVSNSRTFIKIFIVFKFIKNIRFACQPPPPPLTGPTALPFSSTFSY